MFKKQSVFSMLIILLLGIMPMLVFAQPGFVDDVGDVPVDGGLSVLVAAGVGYVIKKSSKKLPNKK